VENQPHAERTRVSSVLSLVRKVADGHNLNCWWDVQLQEATVIVMLTSVGRCCSFHGIIALVVSGSRTAT